MKVLKIGAVWCPGCLVMRPRWEKIEEENPWLETEYFDYDEHKDELNEKYGLGDDLPVFIFIDSQGNELDRLKGEPAKDKMMEMINKYKDK